MKSGLFATLCATVLWFTSPAVATAEQIDTSTISCETLHNAFESKTSENISFVNGILNWMGGYHATSDQGTVVDWAKLSAAFDQTVEYCGEHPGIGVKSASEKFMGENIEDPGTDGVDLAIITCEAVLTNKDLSKNIGDTFMWLAGYHASYNNGSTMLDIEKFIKQTSSIADYCGANPKVGLVTASEKFMDESEGEGEAQ